MKTINVDSHNVPATARSKNYQTALATTAASGGGATTPSAVTPTGGAAYTAKVAQNLAEDSTDWAKILRKDIDERTENALSVGKNLTVDGQAILNDVVANTGTFYGMLKAAVATIIGALSASTVSATTMNANTFIGELQGNAATATKLQTPRTIWGQSFDGSGNVDGTLYITNGKIIGEQTYSLDGIPLHGVIMGNTYYNSWNFGEYGGQYNFYLSNSPTTNARMIARIDTDNNYLSGSLGIGTTSPAYKLDVNGNARIVSDLYADATVGTRNFASHTTGWRADSNGNADFRNIYADELRVQAFTADISQALAGSDYLTKSVSKLSANFVVPAVNSTVRIIVDDIEGMPATQCFSNNDYIRFRAFNRTSGLTIANVWGTVVLDTTFGSNGYLNGTQAYTFTCKATTGAGLTVFKGSEVLDYGISGSGMIARTTLDAMGSPYEQIATWVNDPSNGNNYTVHARLGNLNGIANCNGYGLYTDNGFFTGKITVGDLTKTNNYLDFSDGALTVKGNIYLASGYAAVSTFDMSNGISLAVDNIHVGGRNLFISGSANTKLVTINGCGDGSNETINYTNIRAYLKAGTQYIFSCNTDGEWGGYSDTVEAFLLLNNTYNTYYRMESNVYTFTPSVSGLYYLRLDVNLNNKSYWFSDIQIEEGNKRTTYTPAPEDVDSAISLKVSKDGVIGAINLTSEAATINASKINLVGAVTFNSFTTDVQNTINGKADSAAHGNFTYIDGNSVYTGTLTANQVNAVGISASSITTGTLSADRIDSVSVVANGLSAHTINANNATISNLNVVNATVNGYFHAEYSGGAFVRIGQPTSSSILDIRADGLTGIGIGVYGDNSTGLSIIANGNSSKALDIHGSSYLITRQGSISEGTWINGLSLCRVTITSGGDLGFGSLGWYQNDGYYMPNFIVSKASSNISVNIPSDMPDGAVLIFRAAGDGTINVCSKNFSDKFQWGSQWDNWSKPYAPVPPGTLDILVYDKASNTWYSHGIS